MIQFFKKLWNAIPFRPVVLLVALLLIVEEQFPFSHFPMYSDFGTEADVIFVGDENGNPLAMRRVLNTGTATAKKMYKRELASITGPLGRDSDEATLQERQLAAKRLMQSLITRLDESDVPEGTRELRIYLRTFSLQEDGKLARTDPELLSIHQL